jgi:hypothetical protein
LLAAQDGIEGESEQFNTEGLSHEDFMVEIKKLISLHTQVA